MPQLNVYVDDALNEQMKKHPSVNWSKAAQAAFKQEINSLAVRTEIARNRAKRINRRLNGEDHAKSN